jgi:nucleoside phosphorylase
MVAAARGGVLMGGQAVRHNRVCVVTAADIEFKSVIKLLTGALTQLELRLKVCRGRFKGLAVTVLQTEMGAPKFAERLQDHISIFDYDALLVIGLAGALDPALRTGEVVIYDRCLDGRDAEARLQNRSRENPSARDEIASISCDATLTQELFEALTKQGLRCVRRPGALVERIIIDAQTKLELGRQLRVAAVDMETYPVLAAVADYQLPCAVLRIVLDEAASDLPDFNAGLGKDGRMELGPLLQAMRARPLATLHFLRSLRPALRALRQTTAGALNHFIVRQ